MEAFVKRVEANGVETFRIERWERMFPGLSAGFSSRIGGVSEGGYGSLNCALHVADHPPHVIENRRRLAAAAGFPFEAWTCAQQVHEADVAIITSAERGSGRDSLETALAGKDALITDVKDTMLVSFYADCVPLFFYDPEHEAVGLAHAGWKGTVKQIAVRTVEAMRAAFGTNPERLLAAIGPSIGECCYEVDEPVIGALRASGIDDGWTPQDNGRYLLNLKEINRHLLRKAGILATHIELSELCTGCHGEWFFSHRRDKGRTGRMASWIGVREVTTS